MHGIGHIHRYLPNYAPPLLVYAHNDFGNLIGRNTLNKGYERSFSSTTGTIGYDCVQFAVAQSSLIYANTRPDVLWKDNPLVCMAELFPTTEAAEVVLLLFLKGIGLIW